MNKLTRRDWIRSSAVGAGTISISSLSTVGLTHAAEVQTNLEGRNSDPFRFCLNTSTIRGQRIPIDKIVSIASQAGYGGIEPWINEITRFRDAGGKLADLKKQIADAGLKVESAIGFANWIVDDAGKRKQALEIAKRDMELVKSIGGNRIAAPPAGANQAVDLDLAAERYRELLKVGEQMGVVPQLELWGFSKPINRLGELAYIAAEAGHKNACLLPDVYHIYKGGSDFAGLSILNGARMHVFHINDYPDTPTREKISDGDRVYPGDGIAPLNEIVLNLYRSGFRGALSLELFNREYWKQDAKIVAETGLKKMRAMVDKALGKQAQHP